MTFLIIKMFVYLFVAAAIGGVAGWLFRNLEAQKSEDKAARAAHDAKSKLPQLESLLRGRDEQITKFKDQLNEAKGAIRERDQALAKSEQKVRDAEREMNRWKQSAEAKGSNNMSLDDMDFEAEDTANADELITELSQEIARLKTELAERVEPSTPRAEPVDESLARAELEALQARLKDAERELEAARAQLRRESQKVVELERERELQNKSLKVLHQQLELARNKQAASGG